MRERDTYLLIAGGTLAVHVLLLVGIDAGGVYGHHRPRPPAPTIELVEIEVPDPPTPTPPPTPPPTPAAVDPVVVPRVHERVRQTDPPPPELTPPPRPPDNLPPDPGSGGRPIVPMGAKDTFGKGPPSGHGGHPHPGPPGDGKGSGALEGAGSGAPPPVSIAMIKTRAKPRGDYSFVDKSYPPEARQLGIEGQIKVRLVVDAHGKVTDRRLLGHLGHGLDEFALARAGTLDFDPALDTDDRPVASVVVWTFTFTLPE